MHISNVTRHQLENLIEQINRVQNQVYREMYAEGGTCAAQQEIKHIVNHLFVDANNSIGKAKTLLAHLPDIK